MATSVQSNQLHCYFIIGTLPMIINKISISQQTTPFQRTPLHSQKNEQLLPTHQISNCQAEDFYFDDSHFSSRFRPQSNSKITISPPTPTVIRKVSLVQIRQNKKDVQSDLAALAGGRMMRQDFATFFNYPIESVVFTPEVNFSEGNYHRNYTSCSIRRKTASVLSNYHSRRQLPAASEQEPKRIKILKKKPSPQQEYLIRQRQTCEAPIAHKRHNSKDYSIIKPHEIQAVPLSCRHKQKQKEFDRSYCPDLLNTLRKKEEIVKRHRELEMERHKIRMKISRESSSRRNIQTSVQNRRTIARLEDRNEVLPWEVDSNLMDLI